MLLQCQNDGTGAYEKQKERVVDSIIARLEAYFPGLQDAVVFR